MELGWLVGIIAALSGGLVASMRSHKWGFWLENAENKLDTDMSTDNETVVVIEPEPVSVPSVRLPSLFEEFCLAIRDYEGGPGDANYRNNNPGNFRCSPVGYLAKYGKVRCSPAHFAIFPTYELGWEYLLNAVHHRIEAHPTWTCLDFFKHYAPSEDGNNPLKYAQYVAKRVGISINVPLSKVLA